MSWRISLLILMLFNWTCAKDKIVDYSEEKYSSLIEATELLGTLNSEKTKIIDFRRRAEYDSGHLPGAINVWRTDIEDRSFPYSGMMAKKTQIEKLFSNLGISVKDTIVIYDDRAMCEASRLWWILHNYGFNNVKLLNGGLTTWKAMGGRLDTLIPKIKKTRFELAKLPAKQLYISKDQLKNLLNSSIKIIDTRTIDEYTGKVLKNGAKRKGRIPGSIHLDWAELTNFQGDKRLKPIAELKSIIEKFGIKKTDSLVLYCHSGVRSAHTTFVLHQILGYKNVMNYDGSWTEWSYFNNLPLEKDYVAINKN